MSTLEDALDSQSPTWIGPKVTADWRLAGYAGDGSLDDLSEQAGDSYTVVHSLDDGLPDTVTNTTSANASGVLSLPDATGRSGETLGRVARVFAGQVNTFAGVGGASGMYGYVPTSDNTPAMSTSVVWIQWYASGGPSHIIKYPEGYDILMPQVDNGKFSCVLLGRVESDRVVHEDPPMFTFDQTSIWTCGLMQLQALDTEGFWVPGQINDISVKVEANGLTSHTAPTVTVGTTGNTKGSPMAIFMSTGSGGDWAQVTGGFQLSGDDVTGGFNHWAFAVDGPAGPTTSYTPGGPGNYTMAANTSGPTASGTMIATIISFSFEANEFDSMDGRQYFSPFNSDSPISTLDRDVAPMTLSHGVMTDDGPQYTEIFVGQMASTNISGRTADIEAVSSSRLAMLANVQLPMVNGDTMGANMTWPITYALASCGFYAGQTPSPYSRYFATLHGSMMFNMGAAPTGQPMPKLISYYSDADVMAASGGTGQTNGYQPSSVEGPFVLGMFAERTASAGLLNQMTFRPTNGWWSPYGTYRDPALYSAQGYYDALSQTNSIGRFSCWVRGDANIVTSSAWTITQRAGVVDGLMAFRIYTQASVGGSQICAVEVGIESGAPTANGLYIVMKDNSGLNALHVTSNILPIDGNWHFCSWSWNFAAGTATCRVDDVTTTYSSFVTDPTDMPLTEAAGDAAGGAVTCQFDSWLPISEAVFETGPAVYSSEPYMWDPLNPFTPTAIIRPLPYELAAIIEPAPSAAWDIFVRYAQASFSMYRCDEFDRPCFLPPSYFGEPVLTPFAADSWTRTLASTWGTSDLGGDWAGTAGLSVTGSQGRMLLSTAGTAVSAALSGISVEDFDIRVDVSPHGIATGAQIKFDVQTRQIDATHYLTFSLRFQTDSTVDAYITRNQGAGEVTLLSNVATALTYNSVDQIHLRVKGSGAIVYMKAWNVQNIEPADWTVITSDDAPQAGGFTLEALADTGNTNVPRNVDWDNLAASTQIIEIIDTDTNAQDLNITADPSKIRNDATVQFMDTSVSTNPASVLAYQTAITLPPKLSEVVFALTVVQAQTPSQPVLTNLTAAQVTLGTMAGTTHWMCVNNKADGTGTYLGAGVGGVTATVIAVTSTSITVQFNNLTSKTAYVVNNNSTTGLPFLNLAGYIVTQAAGYTTITNPSSIARRGDRTVSSEIDGIQRRADATSIAAQLVTLCGDPRGTVTVHVMGKPSRTPGQIVQIADAQGTGADGLWLILSVQHNRSSAEYTQDLMLVQVPPEGIWDISNWDEAAWGE